VKLFTVSMLTTNIGRPDRLVGQPFGDLRVFRDRFPSVYCLRCSDMGGVCCAGARGLRTAQSSMKVLCFLVFPVVVVSSCDYIRSFIDFRIVMLGSSEA
jgi:hypothetical protein